MASSRMPHEFYEIAEPLLPPEEPSDRRGGRPRVSHFVVLKVIWYVLTTGVRWCDVPPEMGCSGETARTRLIEWQKAGIWNQIHREMLRLLRRDGKLNQEIAVVDSAIVRAHGGGDQTGPSPVHRGKPGTKYTLIVEAGGIPLGVGLAGANASDHTQILPVVDEEFPAVGGKPGRPRQKPEYVVADAGFDSEPTRRALRERGITPLIRKRGTEHGSGLGVVRWVVEGAVSWMKGLRRLRIRYDRDGTAIAAWAKLATAVINFRTWFHEPCPQI